MPQRTAITRLQVTIMLEKGVMAGAIDIPDLQKVEADDGGWRVFGLALKDMRSTPEASGPAHSILLTSDKEDIFYLAQMALVEETAKISVSIRRPTDPPGTQLAEITVKPGAITLVADVEAGTADPIIEWNFDADNVGNLPRTNLGGFGRRGRRGRGGMQGGMPGGMGGMEGGMQGGMPGGMEGQPGGFGNFGGPPTSSEGAGGFPGAPGFPGAQGSEGGMGGMPTVPLGPRIDARGLVAKFEYPNEEQNYRVEVTVRDRTNKKEPVTASLLVKVRG
ncbi:MAG: hypothetical protein M3347_11665 [Armatimonadota bacterium]|nr:hypothetical protein [Armatimonadota bacterium]